MVIMDQELKDKQKSAITALSKVMKAAQVNPEIYKKKPADITKHIEDYYKSTVLYKLQTEDVQLAREYIEEQSKLLGLIKDENGISHKEYSQRVEQLDIKYLKLLELKNKASSLSFKSQIIFGSVVVVLVLAGIFTTKICIALSNIDKE